MSGGDDRRLRTAIAQFDAVMRQSQLAGPQRDAIDVIVEPSDDEGSQILRVTYTTNSVVAKIDAATGEESIRQGPSAKVGATLRLVRPPNPLDPIQMEIDGMTEPFDASDARVRLSRILMVKAGDVLKAELRR